MVTTTTAPVGWSSAMAVGRWQVVARWAVGGGAVIVVGSSGRLSVVVEEVVGQG